MSTETAIPSSLPTTPANQSAIPEDVEATGIGGAWRFANGKVRKGRQGAFEDYPDSKVFGILRRVGIHSGNREDGVAFAQVEADIETKYGLQHFKSALTNDRGEITSSTATNGFAWGLLQIGKDEQIMITCSEADFVTDKGGKPTFVNIWRSPKQDWRFEQCIRPKRDPKATKIPLDMQWAEFEPDLRKHAAFAERAPREGDEAALTHLGRLCETCVDKGWPTPEQATAEWLEMARIALQLTAPFATLRDPSEDQWGQVRQIFNSWIEKNPGKVPQGLTAYVEKNAAPAAAGAFG